MSEVLPPEIARLVEALAGARGVVGVALGGSRANGTADAGSDWDLGLYYRGELDLAPLARWGEVHPPGSWGRLMNGGAWLSCGGEKVDVLLRDVDVVERWSARARAGEYEVDALLGYVAGAPTYMLAAERACARLLVGELPAAVEYSDDLARVGAARWRFSSLFTLEHARARARRRDVTGALGQAAKATLEEAHARACAARIWVFNEKRLVETSGLAHVHDLFAAAPRDADGLVAWVDALAASLGSTEARAHRS